jgi:hypothetical protein
MTERMPPGICDLVGQRAQLVPHEHLEFPGISHFCCGLAQRELLSFADCDNTISNAVHGRFIGTILLMRIRKLLAKVTNPAVDAFIVAIELCEMKTCLTLP